MKKELKAQGLIGLNEYTIEEPIDAAPGQKESLRKPKGSASKQAQQYSLDVYNHKDEDSDEVQLVDADKDYGSTRRDTFHMQQQIREAAKRKKTFLKKSARNKLKNRFKEPFLAAGADSA